MDEAYLYLLEDRSHAEPMFLAARDRYGFVVVRGFTRESDAKREAAARGIDYIGVKPPPGFSCEAEIRVGLHTPLDRLASFVLRFLAEETEVEVLLLDGTGIPLTEEATRIYSGQSEWNALLQRGGSWKGASFALFTDVIKRTHLDLDRGFSSFGMGKTRLQKWPPTPSGGVL